MSVVKMIDNLRVEVHPNRDEMGRAAAIAAAKALNAAIAEKGEARAVFASAASQSDFLRHLCQEDIDWSKVTGFHQDEWVGVSMDKEYCFGWFIKKYLFDLVNPGTVHYLDGTAADMEAECARYAELLTEKPVDLIVLGVGENGHIAFNEPHEADFNDPKVMKIMTLDEKCRIQQKNDFKFASMDDVPTNGVTVTIPFIMSVENVITVVPTVRKAEAIAEALTGQIWEKCPASILRQKEGAILYLDTDSASETSILNS